MVCLVDTCGWIEWLTDGVLADAFEPYLKNPVEVVVPTTLQFELYKWSKREKGEVKAALDLIFKPIRAAVKRNDCSRAILVGHNPAFDIAFLNAAIQRTQIKRSPFHPFSTFDTATLGGLAYQQTVLAKIAQTAGLEWDNAKAHSALYDAEMTAEIFCKIINRWKQLDSTG